MLSQVHLWENHERRVIEVLVEALAILIQEIKKDDQRHNEVELNRQLYWCLLRANEILRKRSPDSGFEYPPCPEAQNPPLLDDPEQSKRSKKIPDFNWGYIDHTAPDPRKGARYFFIECKRLGKPDRADWILNSNYIANGVKRFIDINHGYAMGELSAAMVGYVQSMDFEAILCEVNLSASNQHVPCINLGEPGWQADGTSTLDHVLERSFAFSPFHLWHYWVDLRSSL